MTLSSEKHSSVPESQMEKGFDLTLAIEEASRCLLCFDPPCTQGCPAGTDPGTFIRKLRFRNIKGAIRTIKENNPFGWTCGVVCPTDRLCELACSRTAIDRPIQIGKLQRFLIEYGWMIGFSPLEKISPNKSKVAVVGSGPAGLTCARELSRKGYSVTVFEKSEEPGGNLRFGIPKFRLDEKGVEREIAEIKSFGVEIKLNFHLQDQGGIDGLMKDGYEAVFFSPGLWYPIRLGIEGSDLEGVFNATDFLRGVRTGKESLFREKLQDKIVAVVGGGSVAMDVAETALRLGAKDVYVIYRRSYAQMPAEEKEKIQALRNGAHFQILAQPIKYIGDSHLKAIRCRRNRLGDPDDSGRRRPIEIRGSEFEIEADFSIETLATKTEPSLREAASSVKWTGDGLVEASKEILQTSIPAVFAGGDIIRGPALVVEAVADGKKAAQAIADYLEKKGVR